MRRSFLFLSAIGLAISLACSGVATGPTSAIPISYELDETEQAKADSLIAGIDKKYFDYKESKKKENAKIFLAIAAANPGDPKIAPAAMRAVSQTWTHYKKTKDREIINDDYKVVVRAYLGSDDKVTLARTLEAAKFSILDDPPDQETIDLMVAVYNRSAGPGKYATLNQLWNLKDWSKNAAVSAIYEDALGSSDAYLVTLALFRWDSGIYRAADREKVLEKLKGLLNHADPGVRGRSASVLSRGSTTPQEKEANGALIEKLLDDKHPFVRSSAASAMGKLKRTSAIPKMIEMLSDSEKNTYDIAGWNQLDGQSGRAHHDGSPWSRVDDAVLWALQTISFRLKPKFKYRKIDYKKSDADIKAAIKDAKAWYAKVKGQL